MRVFRRLLNILIIASTAIVMMAVFVCADDKSEVIYTPQNTYGVSDLHKPFNINARSKYTLGYHSNNDKVATVSATGIVTPKNVGETTVVIYTKNKADKAACKTVTVRVSRYTSASGKVASAGGNFDGKPGDSGGREVEIREYQYNPNNRSRNFSFIIRCVDPYISENAARAVLYITENDHFGYNAHKPYNQEEVSLRRSVYDTLHKALGDQPPREKLKEIANIQSYADTSCTPTLLSAYWLYIDMDGEISSAWRKPFDVQEYVYNCGSVNIEYHQLEKAISQVNQEYIRKGGIPPFELITIDEDARELFFNPDNVAVHLRRGDILCSCPNYESGGHTVMAQ